MHDSSCCVARISTDQHMDIFLVTASLHCHILACSTASAQLQVAASLWLHWWVGRNLLPAIPQPLARISQEILLLKLSQMVGVKYPVFGKDHCTFFFFFNVQGWLLHHVMIEPQILLASECKSISNWLWWDCIFLCYGNSYIHFSSFFCFFLFVTVTAK